MAKKRKAIDYVKVVEAARSGELDKLKAVLVFDNDGGYWLVNDESLSDEEQESQMEALESRFGRPGGYRDIVDLAVACGIKAEWC